MCASERAITRLHCRIGFRLPEKCNSRERGEKEGGLDFTVRTRRCVFFSLSLSLSLLPFERQNEGPRDLWDFTRERCWMAVERVQGVRISVAAVTFRAFWATLSAHCVFFLFETSARTSGLFCCKGGGRSLWLQEAGWRCLKLDCDAVIWISVRLYL